MGLIEKIHHPRTGALLAMVVRNEFRGGKYNFLSPNDFPLQLGVSFYRSGDKVQPHLHVDAPRCIETMQEILYIKTGRALLSVFDGDKTLVSETMVEAGDIAFQVSGGHGLKMLEDTQVIEVKQGPFGGDQEKIRFDHPTH